VADADSNARPQAAESLLGLTNARTVSLERVPIRTRESGVTLSGWWLSVESDQGKGAIALVESSSADVWYRGEGVFLGWGAEDLRAAYEALRPRDEESGFQTQQLG
jgi:hypothetical protein